MKGGVVVAKSVRMSDIAAKMQVSTVTVSKALAGKDGVSEELRREILEMAEKMGYQRKETKTRETAEESLTIGIVTSKRYIEKGHSFYWTLYERILAYLSGCGHIGILEIVSEEAEEQLLVPRLVQEGRIDGMIVMGAFSDAYRSTLAAENMPLTALDSFDGKFQQDSVISDGYYGMYTMTNYLLQLGHRDIVFVGTLGATSSITDRYYGYCRAMLEAGVPVTEQSVLPDREADGMLHLSLDIFGKLPTAFACNCDITAYTLLNTLKEHGIRVPEDVSVVGFDNFILSELAVPQITTYAVDVDRMAEESVLQVIRRIRNPAAPIRHSVVSGSVLIRDSVRAQGRISR